MVRLWRNKKSDDMPRRRRQAENAMKQQENPYSVSNSTPPVFTRNRTLVGSSSTSINSVNELGGDLKSSRTHAHHLSAHRRRLGSLLLSVVMIIGALTWLLYEFTAVIYVNPSVDGITIDQARYQRAINDYLAGRPGERLRVFLNQEELKKYLTQVTPEVANVSVKGARGVATSQFDIDFRQPVAGWLINSKQYYVDKDGLSFQINYFERPTVKIVDQSGVPQTSGSSVASGRFLRFVGQAVELARARNLTIEQALIPAGTTRQIEVRLTGHPYPIKLSLDRPIGEQVEDMQRAVAFFDGRGQKPQYIDVRVSGKAYYR